MSRLLETPIVRNSRLPAWLLAACVFSGLAAGLPAGRAFAASAPAALAPVDGEVIVVFKAQGDTVRKHALAARAARADVETVLSQRAATLGARHQRSLLAGQAVGLHGQVVRAVGVDAQTLARQLAADPDVAYAAPNGRKRIASAPNDPLYAEAAPGVRPNGPDAGQWYLRAPTSTLVSAINIEAAWARTQGSSSVVVAVLDTGVRFDHPDLGRVANGGPLLPGYDFVSNAAVANDGGGWDADPSDPGDWVAASEAGRGAFKDCPEGGSSWHGTSTASLIAAAANNGVGMAGSAPGVRVLPVRVLGKCFGSDADIWVGMKWAAGIHVPGVPDNPNPARVINMSLGGDGACGDYQAVVNEILARGVLIVAAAGNSAGGAVGSPANCRGVMGIAALRHVGSKVGFSDLGPEIALSAPGGNCVNTATGSACLYPILAATDTGSQGPAGPSWTHSYDPTVGTSFSSPLVAGVAALMISQKPSLTVDLLRSGLQMSARPFPTTGADNGLSETLNVRRCDEPDRYPAALYPFGNPNYARDLQCYCTTGLCGAGMLDAGAALAWLVGPFARSEVSNGTPYAGRSVTLSAARSEGSSGNVVNSYKWELVSHGGIVVAGFSGATNAATATLLPTAAGNFSVRLTLADTSGRSDALTTAVIVTDAPPEPATNTTVSSGGGGGAASLWWVLGVLLATLLLALPQLRGRLQDRLQDRLQVRLQVRLQGRV